MYHFKPWRRLKSPIKVEINMIDYLKTGKLHYKIIEHSKGKNPILVLLSKRLMR